jgi:hypothetical protein
MKISWIENFVNLIVIVAIVFIDKWYPVIDASIQMNNFVTITIKYILLYFLLCFMGETASIIYLYSSKNKLGSKLSNMMDNLHGLKFFLIFPLIFFIGMTYIGIMYALYVQMESPYVSFVLIIFCGFINGFQIGVERYYEKNNAAKTTLTKKRKNNIKPHDDKKSFDHSFNYMLSMFMTIFMIFYPINYFIEVHINNVILTSITSIVLVIICGKLIDIVYTRIFINYELEYRNNWITSIFFSLYLTGCFAGFIYYDISMVEIVKINLELNDSNITSKVILLLMTGYLPIRLIPIIFSMKYKYYEKAINMAFVFVYLLRKLYS